MRPAEWRAFCSDVAERGVLEPIRVARDGITVVDGRHRLRAARELGLEMVPTALAACPPGEATAYMLQSALYRRNLSDDQRAILGAHLADEMSSVRRRARAQAAATARWSEGPLAGTQPGAWGTAAIPQASAGPKTREVVASAVGVSERRLRAAQDLCDSAPELASQVEAGQLRLSVAQTRARRQVAQAELAASPSAGMPEGAQVWQGDCRELVDRIPDASVDLILTDPPYRTKDLALWADLGRMAQRVLKPGAFLVSYAGHLDLPAEMVGLAAGGLEYWWQGAVCFQGAHRFVWVRRVRSGWRSVLIYVKLPVPKDPPFFTDLLTSDPHPDKRYHEWGQGIGPARQLLRRFSSPGGLVLDPFAGAGTFVVAAMLEGRRGIGMELDGGHAETARKRLATAVAMPQVSTVR